MSLCRQACRRASGPHDNPIVNYVWVSDTLLAWSYTQFTTTQRRYGSNVPGPLEARRRLARRRNTHLATVGSGGAGIDPSLLFGRKPSEPQHRVASPFESFFLEQTPSNLGVGLRSLPECSRLIFDHVLQGYRNGSPWTIADVGDFLGDPTLNTLGSMNFVAVVQSLVTRPGSTQEVKEVFSMLKQMFNLGAVPRNEIMLMLKLVRRIQVSDNNSKHAADIHGICYNAMWRGIKSCSILPPKDIGRRTLGLWLNFLARGYPSGNSLSVSKDILRLLASNRTSSYSWIRDVLLQIVRLKAMRTPQNSGISYWRNFHRHIHDVNNIGQLFGSRFLLESILRFTESLLMSRRYRKSRRKLLQIWGGILEESALGSLLYETRWGIPPRLCNAPRMRRQLFKTSMAMKRKGNYTRQQWLLKLWLVKVLGRKARGAHQFDSRQRHVFEKLLVYDKYLRGSRPKVGINAYLRGFMRAFSRLGLPHANTVITTSMRIEYERSLRKYQHLPSDVLMTLSEVERGGLSPTDVFWDNEKHGLLRNELFVQWEKLAKQTDVTAPDFANKVLLYTETNSPRRTGLLRLLRRHTPFKIALAYSWDSFRYGSLDGRLRGAQAYTNDGYPILNPTDCLATMHSIALIFACSTKLSPRNSYRLTRWCYEYLFLHNAPIKPTIVRALYHAAIHRYQEAGLAIPMDRFTFVMDKVREVEGDEVANALSSGVPVARCGKH
ncbi:predicted protein [Uncinocarpus reesii 1704]|uniref:Uncharacterized protein n=1 Tax=Uncinocarpus reesii (strain UAMH 1704) TaxID=336963 RepID=C4JFK5_UNCRE|nr:uncharacterized protein UREG_01019 [Uncinocarpus reesii 1704]EEP76170.1 predicted protein [Uncinocarpus reesii 1704]